jgi:hypothetical protein
MSDIWLLVLLLPLICGSIITLGAGGASLGKRVIAAAVGAALIGVLYGVLSPVFISIAPIGPDDIAINCIWRVFVFTILSVIGMLLTELKLPEPEVNYEKIRTG